MDFLEPLIDLAQTAPAAVAAGVAVLLVLALWLRGFARRRAWNSRIGGLQRRFLRATHDRRLVPGGRLHDLMARPLRQWPHAPMVFYQAVLSTVEELAGEETPLINWPEAAADPTVQELATDFDHLMRAIAHIPNPRHLIPRAHRKTALRARIQHLERTKGKTN